MYLFYGNDMLALKQDWELEICRRRWTESQLTVLVLAITWPCYIESSIIVRHVIVRLNCNFFMTSIHCVLTEFSL